MSSINRYDEIIAMRDALESAWLHFKDHLDNKYERDKFAEYFKKWNADFSKVVDKIITEELA